MRSTRVPDTQIAIEGNRRIQMMYQMVVLIDKKGRQQPFETHPIRRATIAVLFRSDLVRMMRQEIERDNDDELRDARWDEEQ